MKKIIFDNDAAIDDIIALVYLASHSSINLVAVTIAGTGEAHGYNGAKNIANLCYMLNRPNVPIAYGSESPISQDCHPFPDFIRTTMDTIFKNKKVPTHPNPKLTDSAVELIKVTLSSSDEPITILSTGPLTNLAAFLEAYPDLRHKIDRIVIMGGAIHVEGNIQALDQSSTNQVAEWNIYTDPTAASIVFASGIPITLVPLDATNQVPMTREFYDTLSLASQPGLQLTYELLKDIVDQFGLDLFLKHFYLWDPLAAMICLHPTLAITEKMALMVDLKTAQIKPTVDGSFVDVAMIIPQAELILKKFIDETKSNLLNLISHPSTGGLFQISAIAQESTNEYKKTNKVTAQK